MFPFRVPVSKWVLGMTMILLLVVLGACNIPASKLSVFATATLTPTMTFTPSQTSSVTPTHTASSTFTVTSTFTPTNTITPSDTPIPSNTPVPSETHAPTDTPTLTATPLPTNTPTVTISPTLEGASVSTEQNVNCRWGPNSVYLVAGLFREGATAQLDGRDWAGNWLWIQMEGFSYHCWVATSAVVVQGDLDSVKKLPGDPPINSAVPSPSGISSVRDGNKVIVTWNPAPSAVDLHYLIRANLCNGQYVLEWIDVTTNTAYTFQDKQGCGGTSSAKIHVVNKTGYSSPASVPWP